MKSNDFEKLKGRIRNEKSTFDVSEAGRGIGLSPTVFYSAIRKPSFDKLTTGEFLFLEEIVRILDNRKKRMNNLAKSAR
ncbi:MAG: hypothetical protein LBC19_13635 [Tannerella sp.]|jgi:hypothetical protein|nr:hypothetical protein [Tannerella sp.]